MTTARPQDPGTERGSIILVLMVVVVLLLLVGSIGTEAVAQLNVSSAASLRNNALQASLAGGQAAVAAIRATPVDSNGDIISSQLPCGAAASFDTVTGTSAGGTGASTSQQYQATITYQQVDVNGTYTDLACTGGSLPAPAAGEHLARAVIISCAPAAICPSNGGGPAAGPTWRRTVSTYTFKTTNVNIIGGQVNTYQYGECMVADYVNGVDTTGGLRLDVTSSCGSTASLAAQERFEFTATWQLEIQLANQTWCLQDPQDGPTPSTGPLLFTTSCATPSSGTTQWGIDDEAEIQGVSTGGGGNPNGWCINNPLGDTAPATGTTTTQPALLAACTGGYDNTRTWQLAASVGAGGAAPSGTAIFGPTDQMVNYQEFGRCMDVTNQDVGSSFLIDYTCKQFPNTGSYPTWNQRWCFLPASAGSTTGILLVERGSTTCPSAPDGSSYCAQSPLTKAAIGAHYVTLTNSCSQGTAAQQWTEWGSSGGAIHSYTFTDHSGYCLEANTSNPQKPPGNNDAFTTIQVDTCSGSYTQKWNAPATYGQSQIGDTHEANGTGAVTGP